MAADGSSITNALWYRFATHGMEIQPTKMPYVYQANHSYATPARIAKEIITSSGHCPIISRQRCSGELLFTVVPYKKGFGFDGFHCPRETLDSDTLWQTIMSIPSSTQTEGPLCINGVQCALDIALTRKKMPLQCKRPSTHVVEYTDACERSGKVLDLGAGIGVNSALFLNRGWEVHALDILPEALEAMRTTVDRRAPSALRIEHADITDYDYTALPQQDAVVAVDVLPYIKPEKMQSLLANILSVLRPGGTFIGTLFFQPEESANLLELMNQLGAHLLPQERLIPALLEESGFEIVEANYRIDEDDFDAYASVRSNCVEFVVKKPDSI